MQSSPETESEPLREKLLPQASLRFFLGMIGASALVMVVFRVAVSQEVWWAKIAVLMLAILAACFASYAILFLLASLFSEVTRPLRSLRSPTPAPAATPTVGEES